MKRLTQHHIGSAALTRCCKIISLTAFGFAALIGAARAGTVTVTIADDGVSNIGAPGSFFWALTNCNPGDTIAFAISGAGPHYIKPPLNGFPLLYQKHNVTIDGYTQSGSSVNTAAITATNNSVIKIVLDSRNGNFTDMAYVYYGTENTNTTPLINNSALYGDGSGTATGRERGGYDPNTHAPDAYTPGEVATLGVYRSTNVTIKGLAFVSPGSASSGYQLAVAQDFGYDTAIKERFQYDGGTCRGFHVAGCWFGIDPGTGGNAGAGSALTMFRHRDRGSLTATTRRPSVATDPDDEGVPNGEGAIIGVAPGAPNPRAEFNVFGSDYADLDIGAELARTRISGNQFFFAIEVGRYSDTQVPSLLFGTDGDGVNDADEGNLFLGTVSVYNTRAKVYKFAGNVFNLARDGSRPGVTTLIDEFDFSGGIMVQFGSDFDGVSDALEANQVYDGTFLVNVTGAAASNGSWLSTRGNKFVNCSAPLINSSQLTYFGKFMDTSVTALPAIGAGSTVSLLTGTCSTPVSPYSRVFIDLYISDPEGDALSDPQGKTYLGTFEDNGSGDGNAAVGAFSFNIASLGLTAGTKVTLTANYANESKPSISSITVTNGTVDLAMTGGNPTYNILQASSVTGPYTSVALTKTATATLTAGGSEAYYRVACASPAVQTSPFAESVALNP